MIDVFAWCALFALALSVPATLALRYPARPRGDLAAPVPGAADPVWERFNRRSRTLEQMHQGLPVGLILLTPVLGADGPSPPIWALVVVAIAVAIAAFWVAPGARRERGFTRALLEARGVSPAELADPDYIELWEPEPPEEVPDPWESLGFAHLTHDGLTLHTPAERLSIPYGAIEEIEARPVGVHSMGIRWRTPSGAKRTVHFMARSGETRGALADANRDLAARFVAWHAEHAEHAEHADLQAQAQADVEGDAGVAPEA